jgi:transcriptional regulator with XRE-family HTH domain
VSILNKHYGSSIAQGTQMARPRQPKTLGERLVHCRKHHGMTQSYVAKELGILNTSISHYENDMQEPSLENLRRFASLYDTSIEYLLSGKFALEQVYKPVEQAALLLLRQTPSAMHPHMLSTWRSMIKAHALR